MNGTTLCRTSLLQRDGKYDLFRLHTTSTDSVRRAPFLALRTGVSGPRVGATRGRKRKNDHCDGNHDHCDGNHFLCPRVGRVGPSFLCHEVCGTPIEVGGWGRSGSTRVSWTVPPPSLVPVRPSLLRAGGPRRGLWAGYREVTEGQRGRDLERPMTNVHEIRSLLFLLLKTNPPGKRTSLPFRRSVFHPPPPSPLSFEGTVRILQGH